MKTRRLLTDACFTSFSGSLIKLVKIYTRETSVISFPTASANSAKFLARANLTLQDLSSVAAIIIGIMCYLLSSLLRTLATIFKLLRPSTRT